MTEEQLIRFEHRFTELEERSKSNTKRLSEHDEAIKKDRELIVAIKELAIETKHMREEINDTVERLDRLENKDDGKWDKFKWLLVSALVTIIVGFIAVQLGLK